MRWALGQLLGEEGTVRKEEVLFYCSHLLFVKGSPHGACIFSFFWVVSKYILRLPNLGKEMRLVGVDKGEACEVT